MKQADWDRIQEIYHEARKLSPVDQRAYVEKASAGDTVLAGEVMELLAQAEASFMAPPVALGLASSDNDLVGTTIDDRYFIEKELGAGGMSEVYLARDLRVNRKAVVVKILSLELLDHPYARQKFDQEVEALSRIDHDRVVDVFDKGELPDGRPYFVMTFIDGRTLRSQIPGNGMNPERAAWIIEQVGSALEYVHENDVRHRDLKPENVMLKRGDSVVLIDFGIAKVIDSIVTSGTAIGPSAGTLMYMSPEQLQGEEVTAASDIYSMAVVAHEMITGQRPFNPVSREELLEQQASVDTALNRKLSPKVQEVLRCGLSIDPLDRYQNAKQFGDDLADALRQRSPWLRVAMIVLGVALLSVGTYLYKTCGLVPSHNRSFDYFLTVQRMHDGQPYGDPRRSHGEEIFEGGDKFRLTVKTTVDAFVYVFHEEAPKENETSLKMIFPREATNNKSASLGAGQSIDFDWMTFPEPAGVENFWIVWSTTPVTELEAVKDEAFKNAGGLTGDTLVRVKQYLTSKNAEIKAITNNYNGNQTAIVRAKRDLLVALAQFQHR